MPPGCLSPFVLSAWHTELVKWMEEKSMFVNQTRLASQQYVANGLTAKIAFNLAGSDERIEDPNRNRPLCSIEFTTLQISKLNQSFTSFNLSPIERD